MQDHGLGLATGLLRVAAWVNALFGIVLVAALATSLPFGEALAAHLLLKYPGGDAAGIVNVMRGMAVIGIAGVAAMHRLLSELSKFVATVRLGDPFVVANAYRLRRVGWALLVLQMLDLAVGLVVAALDRMGVDHAAWTPALSGWIAVAMIFVLARVFRVGAAMREDLEMTV